MFKYIKDHLTNIDGINIYPVISLLIFFVFFVVLLYYVKKMDKNKIEEICKLPLDQHEQHDETNFQNNLKKA
jgi:hypothetical protein